MATELTGNITFSKDWDRLEKYLSYSWESELEAAMNKALKWGSLYILGEIRRRIDAGQYVANAPWTVKKKGFNRPLIDKGRMIRSLHAQKRGKLSHQVGFIRDQPTSDGKSTLFKVVPMLHEGATVTMVLQGRLMTIRIPPRPFLRDVWSDPMVQSVISARITMETNKILKKYGKL